jgi:hypothetical protein
MLSDWEEIQDRFRELAIHQDDHNIGVDEESVRIVSEDWVVEILPDIMKAYETDENFPHRVVMRDYELIFRRPDLLSIQNEQTRVDLRLRY